MPRQLVTLGIVLGVGDVFLSVFDLRREHRHVEVLARLGAVGENGQTGRAHLGEAADNDNRLALTFQPWGVVLPIIAIALLTIGTNLLTDAFARAAIGIDRGGD